MKRISLLGLFALFLVLSAQQQASAWLNFKFGVGLNWNWQSGGNNWLWGLFRNGQPPGYGNTCDPSCLTNSGACNPFNVGACPQQCGQPMMPQGCMPQGCMPQGCMPQGYMPQQYPGCPQSSYQPNVPNFSNGLSGSPEFQYFGFLGSQPNGQGDAASTVAAYNPYTWSQSSYCNPYSSSSYYGNAASCYGNSLYYYGNGSGWYGNGANYNSCYGNASGYYGNGTNFYSNGSGYYGNEASYYGNGSGYYGNGSGYYGNGANYYGNSPYCYNPSNSYGTGSSYDYALAYQGNGNWSNNTPAYSSSSASYSNPCIATNSSYHLSPYSYCRTTCCNGSFGR